MDQFPYRLIGIIIILLLIALLVIWFLNPAWWEFRKPTETDHGLQSIDSLMADAIDQGVFAGGTVLVARGDEILYHRSFGYSLKYADETKTLAEEPVRATNRTIYDLASISKIFTAMAVMKLAEQNKLDLDVPVSRYLPPFRTPEKQRITVRQLLSHTSGLPASLPLDPQSEPRQSQLQRVWNVPLMAKPGTQVVYSDVGYMVLGQLVERVSGMPLDQYVNRHILKPLQLDSTQYRPPRSERMRIAATEVQKGLGRGLVWGEVHDENAWVMKGVAGHAGLFGTAEDLWKVAKGFLPASKSPFVLQKGNALAMTRPATEGIEGPARGLGFELAQKWYMGSFAEEGAFGHTGFTGTSFFIAPKQDIIVILLTNRVHPVRTGPSINPIRQRLAEIVFQYAVSSGK